MERFVFAKVNKQKEYQVKNETVKSVKKLLDKVKIDYKIDKDVVTLTSKLIPDLMVKAIKDNIFTNI